MTEGDSTSGRRRWLRLAGRVAIILLLVSCLIPNVTLLMVSTAPGARVLGWLAVAHPLVTLYVLGLLAWRRGAVWTWRVLLGLGLLPWLVWAALMGPP